MGIETARSMGFYQAVAQVASAVFGGNKPKPRALESAEDLRRMGAVKTATDSKVFAGLDDVFEQLDRGPK